MLLDEVLPRWHVREQHGVDVDAPAERALAAMREVTLEELPVVRALFRLRGLGRSPTQRSLWEALVESEFDVVADDGGREVVLAAVGRPWTLRGGIRHGVDVRSFDAPGYAKMALGVVADGRTLSTETRVVLTDAAARRRFRVYWLVIRPFSGLIRRLWLQAAKRRAEAATG